MVDALTEARRVLMPKGVLIDVRPVLAPMVVEVLADNRASWAAQVSSFADAEEYAAADAAVGLATSRGLFVFEKRQPFEFEVYCDTSADLKQHAQLHRGMREADIPYEDLEARRRELEACGQTARLRCGRPWMLSAYHKE